MDCSIRRASVVTTCLLTMLVAPSVVCGQIDPLDLLSGRSPRSKTPKAEFTTTVMPESVRPGETVTVSVTAKLPRGYYIYGTDGDFGGRTRITVSSLLAEPVDAEFVPDHPGKTEVDPNFKTEVTKFHDGVTWTRKYRVSPDATGQEVRFTGKLEGQYCSTEQGGLCIQILPAHTIDVVAQLASTAPTPRYVLETRPTRKSAGTPTPDPIAFRFRLSPKDALPGGQVTLSVTAMLDEGWHTYSLSQTGLGAAPTEFDISPYNLEPIGEGFEADRPYVIEEEGDIRLESHYKEVTWSRQFRVTGDRPGDYGVEGDVTYVVCKENVCKPLNVMSFAVGVPAESNAAQEPVIAEATGEMTSPFTVTEEPESTEPDQGAPPLLNGLQVAEITLREIDDENGVAAAEPVKNRALLPFLLLCVGGGFLALLTPCSFPMVPITVSFFLKQSELNHRRPWLLALVYCGSIVLAFTVLGVGISAVFGATKLNELANNAWLNLAIGLVFVAFALNMLGAFEIRIPSSLLSWSAGHESGGSYLGAVFMALTFTLTSFTCTFAVAGSLLVSAAQGEVYWPTVGMLAFGTAFAAPFFILALVPGMLKKLPKSGGWMNSVKVVMGLIEFGAAVKFFSIADLAWNPVPVVFDFVSTMLIWLVLSLAIAMYLLGVYRFAHDTPCESISTMRGLLAFSFLGLTAMIGYLILQPDRAAGFVMQQIVAFAPPDLNSTAGDVGPQIEHHGIKFALDLERAMPVAQRQQQPLLLDFTGINCVNCRRMELKMSEPENKRRIENFIAVQLYADKVPAITDPQLAEQIRERNLERQENWFGDVSLPSYAVVTPDGKEILAAYIGYEQREGHFGRFLDYGLEQWKERQEQAGDPVLSELR